MNQIYIITGQPVVLKNSKRIIKHRGRTKLVPSAKVMKAEKLAIWELKKHCDHQPLTGWLAVTFTFFGAWKANSGNLPDLSNLFEAPQDWMQKAGVIADDRQIVSLDYSRRVPMCDACEMRQKYVKGAKKGQFKPDCGAVKQCPFERTEIQIKEIKEN